MEPDIDAADEQLWELYLIECERTHTHPGLSDYLIWLEDTYGYTPVISKIPDEVYQESAEHDARKFLNEQS